MYAEKRYHELRAFSETQNFALKKEAIVQWQQEMQIMPLVFNILILFIVVL